MTVVVEVVNRVTVKVSVPVMYATEVRVMYKLELKMEVVRRLDVTGPITLEGLRVVMKPEQFPSRMVE